MIDLYIGDPLPAMRELRKALTLAPMMPEVHDLYGRMLIELGQSDRGINHLEAAVKLDPTFEPLRYEIARARALQGDWPKAEKFFASIPTDPMMLNAYWIIRARLLMWRGDADEAKKHLTLFASVSFGMRAATEMLLQIVATRQIPAESRAELTALFEGARTHRRRQFFAQLKAECFAFIAEAENALAALESAAENDLFDVLWIDHCPLLDALRSDPRFVAIRERVAHRAEEVLSALSAPA
jgi:serine/threonine-protein kinase